MSASIHLRPSKIWIALIHVAPAIAAVLLLLLDFQFEGRLRLVNRPYSLAAIAPLIGLALGIPMRVIPRKPSSIAVFYVIHLVVSVAVLLLVFTAFIHDSL